MAFEGIVDKVCRLYHEEKMSGTQIAKALGLSASTVYNYLHMDRRGVRTPYEVGMLQTIRSMYGYIPLRYKDRK